MKTYSFNYETYWNRVENVNYSLVIKKLEDFSNKFLKENFNLELSCPIVIDGRLKCSLGSFHYNKHFNKALKIKLNKNFVAKCVILKKNSILLDTLKHELIHYALFSLGKDFKDGDLEFEKTLAEFNVSASSTTNKSKVKTLKNIESIQYFTVYSDGFERYKYSNTAKKLYLIKPYKELIAIGVELVVN